VKVRPHVVDLPWLPLVQDLVKSFDCISNIQEVASDASITVDVTETSLHKVEISVLFTVST